MTKLIKNKILNHLYKLKLIGYEYHKDFDIFSSVNMQGNYNLPDNIDQLDAFCNHCYLCDLSKNRKNVLFGYGNTNSKIMFLIDEPSYNEDAIGQFYVGKSGELLKNMIENVLKVKKEDVYITSLVKCKSIDGASLSNVESCNDYLQKQIDIIKPKIFVIFGQKAYSYVMKNNGDFMQIRGKEIFYNNIKTIVTFDANYLLRNPSFKKEAYYDMIKIRNLMEELN